MNNTVGKTIHVRVGIGQRSAVKTGTILATRPGSNRVLVKTDDGSAMVDAIPPASHGGVYETEAFTTIHNNNPPPHKAARALGYNWAPPK